MQVIKDAEIMTILGLTIIFQATASYSQNTMQKIWEIKGKANGEELGTSVAGIGDINKDGFDDVAVCSRGLGKTFIYLGAAIMDTTPDLTLRGGMAVAGKGDVNHDGYIDIMTSDSRNVYLYLGSGIMDSVADLIFHEEGGEYFGGPIAFIPDFNGDGFSDILIGDITYLSYTGRVYIYLGGSLTDNQADWTKQGEAEWIYFAGGDISSLDDLNGDGYSDAIIGSGWYPGNPYYNGMVQIYFGGAIPDTICDVSTVGAKSANLFGNSVSSLGDVNGDGYPDILVGAKGGNFAHIYYGGPSIDTIPDVIMLGDSLLDRGFGFAVACAGDINGDGYSDVIIGDPDAYGYMGWVRIYLGGPDMDGKPDVTIVGHVSDFYFGQSVSSAGDVNRDGYDDVIIGSPPFHYWLEDYWGRAVIYAGNGQLTSVEETEPQRLSLPQSCVLYQNYPNPFNNSTVIRYSLSLSKPTFVELVVYNLTGEEVRVLVKQSQQGGSYETIWDGKDDTGKEVSSGLYYYELRLEDGFRWVKKLILMR